MNEAFRAGGFDASTIGLAAGSLVFFAADVAVSRWSGRHRKRSQGQQSGGSGTAIAIGALLDGIPESMAIGIGLLGGKQVSVGVLTTLGFLGAFVLGHLQ